MTDSLKDVAQDVIRQARLAGATAADALIVEDETFSAVVRMGEVETLKEAVSRSLRLRVFYGKRTAASQTSDFSPNLLQRLVKETVEMARLTSEDESGGLPEAGVFEQDLPDLELEDPWWDALSPAERIDMARRAEASSMVDPAIVNSEGGSFEYSRSRTVLANSQEFVGSFAGTSGSIAAVPIAVKDGAMERDYWYSVVRQRDRLESPEDVGRRAAERVLRRIGARKVKTCEATVVFDPLTARSIVSQVFKAVAGDSIYRRSSFLVDRLGEMVAAPSVTIVDDGRIKAGLGSCPFDEEGVPTRRTPLIEHGRLANYLHSAYTARKLGGRPTGNGNRTAAGSVAVGPTNCFLDAGPYSPEEIVASVKSGLYVFEIMGAGINLVNGDFSQGAAGIWIENGKMTYPVHEVTIAGNLTGMLRDIDMIGSDLLFLGSVASPTLRIARMVISGE